MAISTEGKIGIGLGLIGLAGAGAIMVWPTITEIGWGLIAVAVGGAAALAFHHFSDQKNKTRMIPLLGMLVCAVGLIGFGVWYFWPMQSSEQADTGAIAELAESGWTVTQEKDGILFQLLSKPLPPMAINAKLFAKIHKPFRIIIQQPPSLDGLHLLANIPELYELALGPLGFTDITELRNFHHLKNLGISQTPFSAPGTLDLSPLASLTNLTSLRLGMCRVRDISPLSGLVNLTYLSLNSVPVTDISPLVKLTAIQSLDLQGTNVKDLTALSKLDDLAEIHISDAQMNGLSVLVPLPKLKKIMIVAQSAIDLTNLGKLQQLESAVILIGMAPIGQPPLDLSPLQNLSNLKELTIDAPGFTGLQRVKDDRAIADLRNLRKLALSSLAIADIEFVRSLSNLEELTLNQIPSPSIEAVRGLSKLTKIQLTAMPVFDVSPLLDLPALSEVTVARTPARSDVLSELERRGVTIKRY